LLSMDPEPMAQLAGCGRRNRAKRLVGQDRVSDTFSPGRPGPSTPCLPMPYACQSAPSPPSRVAQNMRIDKPASKLAPSAVPRSPLSNNPRRSPNRVFLPLQPPSSGLHTAGRKDHGLHGWAWTDRSAGPSHPWHPCDPWLFSCASVAPRRAARGWTYRIEMVDRRATSAPATTSCSNRWRTTWTASRHVVSFEENAAFRRNKYGVPEIAP
jgi:hypothetical protein